MKLQIKINGSFFYLKYLFIKLLMLMRRLLDYRKEVKIKYDLAQIEVAIAEMVYSYLKFYLRGNSE